MAEQNGDQGVGATAFDYPNAQHPEYENKIHHTNARVPRPTNHATKMTSADKVMSAVLEAK